MEFGLSAAFWAMLVLGWGGIWPNLSIITSTRGRVHRSIEQVPDAAVALVLGCAPTLTSGQNNVYFTARMTAAAELVAAGKVTRVVVSGGPLRATAAARPNDKSNEAKCMQQALIQLGVPAHCIDLDADGLRTRRSVDNLVGLTSRRTVTIVSQAFHTPRALYLAARVGFDAHAYNARSPHWSSARHLKLELREVCSRIRAFWER